ncbi:TIGR02234 family membrane protein [Actinacidiphila glaucinigra]|uniref:TIGR02234 family membrane protein n=1 Tax=Actinacidiphila glaucinigra TaxID=235986 RepID=UPI002DDA82B6|nr:TIGR02234 family membrane protein [Actinacidiphila glaucinigra]WSD62682.1 TIGR02234 family membrane protein [Actinacidiphila glaucinigra]
MSSSAPQPSTVAEPAADPAARRTGGRGSLVLALASGVLGAAVVLLASSKTWQEGSAPFADGGMPVRVSGHQVTGVPGALALVGLAALVAVFAVRGAARLLVGGLLALCGAGALAAALLAFGDTAALDAAAATASGLSRTTVTGSSTSAWPGVSAAGGVLLLLAGIVALLRARTWPGMSNRYDRDTPKAAPPPARTAAAPGAEERPEDLWKALDRGEDPTESP